MKKALVLGSLKISYIYIYTFPECEVAVQQLSSSRERDFFRWLKLPLETYTGEVPVHVDASKTSNVDGRGTAAISMVLPSDHLRALHEAGPNVLLECLGSWKDFGAVWHAAGCGEISSTHVPLIIHEDAVPHFSGSTATVWSWSTGCVRGDSWKTRQAIAIMGTSEVTDDTRACICRVLAWDLRQLEAGAYDFVNHDGKFHPVNFFTREAGW